MDFPYLTDIVACKASLVAQSVQSACNVGDLGSIPESERSPGEGKGNPLQFSCLENPVDRGAWQAMVHGVAKSGTQLKRIRTSAHFERFSLLPSSGRILSFLY